MRASCVHIWKKAVNGKKEILQSSSNWKGSMKEKATYEKAMARIGVLIE